MERVPVLKLGDVLLVSIQVDLDDHTAVQLQEDLAERIVASGARGVIIDISALDIVDSFIGRMLSTTASVSRVLDAETVVVGMRPAVAITLVELGLSLPGVRTALDVERGLDLLALARAEAEGGDGQQPDGQPAGGEPGGDEVDGLRAGADRAATSP
jgi:rsbT antagonist protein RsbS